MRVSILFLLILSFLQANPVVNIYSEKFNIKDFELSYFIDNANKIKFEDLKSIQFTKGKNRDL